MINHTDTFYYPYCKEKGCDGVLKLEINDDFSIVFECDKNDKHKKNKIYFKTFERFYLKEKSIDNCSKCNCNVENDIYKCTKCKSIYCCYCFQFDEHIKQDFANLYIINRKCQKHKRELIYYCFSCKKYLCTYCLKENKDINNIHNAHDHHIICLIDLIPTESDIDKLKNKINQRAEKYNELINSLEEWEKKIISKIEELKNNLRYEIELMKKLLYNYNKYFLNYTYFKNFEYFKDYFKSINSKRYNQCYSYDDLENILEKLFNSQKEEKIQPRYEEFEYSYTLSDGILFKINDEHFFSYSYNTDEVKIVKINPRNNFFTHLEKTQIDFRRKINSASLSHINNKIFACLRNIKAIKIFNFNLENNLMEESLEEIVDTSGDSGRFNKCLEIEDGLIIGADSFNNLILWKETETNKYTTHRRLTVNSEIFDLLLINDDILVASQPLDNSITFYKTDLTKVKTIENLDIIVSNDNLFLCKEYILVNCKKGIAVISIKTKELVQYIENDVDNIVENSKGLFVSNDNIYILNKKENDYSNKQIVCIKVLTIDNNVIKLVDEIKETEIQENGNMKIMVMGNNNIILWGNKVHSLVK